MGLGPETVMTACLGLVVVVLVLGLAGVYFVLSNEQEELTYRIAHLEQTVHEQAQQLDLERRGRHTPVIKLEPGVEVPPAEFVGECAHRGPCLFASPPLTPCPRTVPTLVPWPRCRADPGHWPQNAGRAPGRRGQRSHSHVFYSTTILFAIASSMASSVS